MSGLTRWTGPVFLLVVAAIAVVFPLVFTDQLITYEAVITLIFVASVTGWNMFSGYSGYISLGNAVFFGTGAYTVAILAYHQGLNSKIVFATLPLAGLAAAIVAVPFGLVALRVRRHTFVVVTIAIFFIFQLMAYNFSFTGGTFGIAPPFENWSSFNTIYYYAALIIAALAILLSWAVRGSRFGLQLLAIRDDEDRARGLGVRAMRVKVTALVLSGFVSGVAGGLWIFFLGQAYPNTVFDPNFDLTVALMGFLGGFGTLWGPVLGALILEPLQQWVNLRFTNGYVGLIFLGSLFLLVILFMPRGLLPTGREYAVKLRAWWERRGQAPAGAAPPAAVTVGAGAGPGQDGAAEGSGVPRAGGVR
jgi:branched-chain amino acid transport system permease protein